MFQQQVQQEIETEQEQQEQQQVESNESIDHVSFRLLSERDIQKLSVVQIRYQKPFVHGKIKEHGLHDLRMGATTQFDPCQTCHESIETCNGHFGHIVLTYPIYHALCFKNVIKILNCVCFSCFHLVIDIDQTSIMAQELKTKTKSNRKMRQDQFEDLDSYSGTSLDFLYLQSKHKSKCEQCGFPKHKIEQRKLDLKIVWKQTAKAGNANKQIFTNADDQAYATQLSNHFDAAFILFCLRQLPTNLREWILGPLDASCFLLMNILVPPSITRPYTSQGKSMGVNELTSKLDEIVGANVSLLNQTPPVWFHFVQKILHMDFDCTRFPPNWVLFETWCEYNGVAPTIMHMLMHYSVDMVSWKRRSRSQCMRDYVLFWMGVRADTVTPKWLEQYASLKYHASVFLDNGLRMHKPDKKTVRMNAFAKGIVQRLKGKYGRFRWNLQGKRVDQCARSVVVPEAYLDIDELALPMFIAKQLTIPETVQAYNRAQLQALIIKGSAKWPGCNSVVKLTATGGKQQIELELLSRAERELLAKELQFGDKVLRHLRDGDICLFNRQPSLHRPSIMGHRVRVVFGTKGIGLHECVTHPYNADFDGDEMNVHQPQSLEARAEVQEFMMVDKQYANHQTIGVTFGMKQNPLLALAHLSSPDVFINKADMMQYATLLQKTELPPAAFCQPTEWWTGRQLICLALPDDFVYKKENVHIERNEWIGAGTLDKKHLGAGQGQLFHVLLHQLGSNVVKRVFSDLHRLGSEWLLHHGFSVGLSDCCSTSDVSCKRDQIIGVVEDVIRRHEPSTAESKTTHFLSTLLNFTQPPTMPENRIWTMVACGSKGNMNNLTQIMCMLGQQTIDGKRITKPFYPTLKTERTVKHSGLATHSYFEGLTTSEFYMHCAAGRKGLVDTAVSTASTGYAQRRVIKILESIFMTADGSVRTTDQQIVNINYGICNLSVSSLQPYRLQTQLELMPELWHILRGSYYNQHLDRVLTQQLYLGQNVVRSHSRHVHDIHSKPAPVVIEIPFDIDHVWNRFLKEYPFDPNPQEMNLRVALAQPLLSAPRYFILKVLLTDWFATHPYRDDFIEFAKQLYDQGLVPPGEAVGTVAAESIGEPATQTTLNTFHYAGVLQQNVTHGIPRLKEICSLQKQMKTPMIVAYLLTNAFDDKNDSFSEHWCDTLIERKMSYFTRNIEIDGTTQQIRIEFHHERMIWHRVSPFTFAQLLRMYIGDMKVKVMDGGTKTNVDGKRKRQIISTTMHFHYHPHARIQLHVNLQFFMAEIAQQIVQSMRTDWIMSGVRGVESAHMYRMEENEIFITMVGTNEMTLQDVWDVYPIDARRTFSNNILEVESVLGIDASKYVLFKEMKAALSLEGNVVHDNHIRLLVDVMTCTGKLLPTDRNGLEEFARDNVLTRASFEKNTDVLRQAAITHHEQSLNGISEAIMVGSDLALGTGASKMICEETKETTNNVATTTFVTTNDWDEFDETAWDAYFALIDHIRMTLCLYTSHVRPHHPHVHSTDTYLTRKRKQNDIVHIHYRPSSPKLVISKSNKHESRSRSSSINANNGSNEFTDASVANEDEENADDVPLTVESISALITSLQSAATTDAARVTEAFGLMQTLVSESLKSAFDV